MKTRKIGPFEVSAVGLGCMNMSMGYGPLPEPDYSGRLLNKALDHGYTFLDTAAMYGLGHNEELIGKYLCGRRNEYTLASKCGIFKNAEGNSEINGHPDVLRATCESSLKRLKTEVIDLHYLHRIDPKIPIEESIGALSRLAEAGKIRTLGVSEISSNSLRRAHGVHPITAVQSEYSLWTRTPERKILQTCNELGITFVPFSPLARQFLTGKCPPSSEFAEDDIRKTNSRPRFEPENYAHNSKLLAPFGVIADRVGCSMAQLALAWLLAQGENIVPIPGTKHIEYMLENLAASEIQLDAATVEELDQLINENTVQGRRYHDKLMETIDSEKD